MIYLIFRWLVAGFCYCGGEYIYEVIYEVIYMIAMKGNQNGFYTPAASLTRFVSVATGARRKDKRGIRESSCKALARSRGPASQSLSI